MKFSDALRGAADRAPVEQLQVSTADAAGRIKRERALRMGGNGLMGAGAAAIIAVGAVGPIGASANDMAAMAVPAMDSSAEMFSQEDSAQGDGEMAAGETRLAEQWMCGSAFDPADGAWTWGDTSGVTLTAGEIDVAETQAELPLTLEAHRPVDLLQGADHVITWEGIVVGRAIEPAAIQYGPADEPSLPEGEVYERLEPGTDFETLEQWTVMDLVNCWDGEALPAGEYQVHAAWTLAYGADEADVTEPDMPEVFKVATDPVALTIDGDVVDDPFADYLGGDNPDEPYPFPGPTDAPPDIWGGAVPLPEGYLTPEIARDLFNANVVDGQWDMAPGTQRWIKMNDSTSPDDDWMANFFGCSWDGNAGTAFPAQSAELNLLDVDVNMPRSIGVSYGFVVDGNPLLSASVTNVSDFTLPGFWSAQPQLFLVKDGRVVAEGYPVSLGQDGMAITMEERGLAGQIEPMIVPDQLASLAPGTSQSGEYLWRDINGCHTQSGRTDVNSGTYTVLAMHTLGLSGGQATALDGGDSLLRGDGMDGSVSHSNPLARIELGGSDLGQAGVPETAIAEDVRLGIDLPDIAISAAPYTMDWLELQAWTSLGTITVSAR